MKKRLAKISAVAMALVMTLSTGNVANASGHKVAEGDTLWKLATKYYHSGYKYIDIFNANDSIIKNPDRIYPGQILEIPGTDTNSNENADSNRIISKPVHIEGAMFGGKPSDSIAVDAVFDPAWITTNDNQTYNKNLANFSIIATADTYFKQKDIEAGKVNRVIVDGIAKEDYTITTFMEQMGFTDVEFVETFKRKSYEEYVDDSATFIMAYKNVDEKYDSFAFVFRGSYSSSDWCSAFETGDSGNIHHGFELSSARAMEEIDKYIASHDDINRPNTALITGHSKGGGIANIIGATMEDDPDIKSYTYTFCAPAAVYNSSKKYKTIFNVADANDLLNEGFRFKNAVPEIYGTNVYVDISSSPEIKGKISALTGRDDYASVSREGKAEFQSIFEECFTDRGGIYKTKIISEQYDSEQEALNRISELEGIISEAGLGLTDMVEVKDPVLSEGKYKIEIKYSDAALLQGCAMVFAFGKPAGDGFVSLFKGNEKACTVAEFVINNAQLFNSGHRMINVYAITKDD